MGHKPSHTMGQVIALLSAIGRGEQSALGELYELLYPELRRLAHSRMRRSGEVTLLDTTSLVHESDLRFEASGAVAVRNRGQFMAYPAKVMRSVVVDMIRSRHSERRGGNLVQVVSSTSNCRHCRWPTFPGSRASRSATAC